MNNKKKEIIKNLILQALIEKPYYKRPLSVKIGYGHSYLGNWGTDGSKIFNQLIKDGIIQQDKSKKWELVKKENSFTPEKIQNITNNIEEPIMSRNEKSLIANLMQSIEKIVEYKTDSKMKDLEKIKQFENEKNYYELENKRLKQELNTLQLQYNETKGFFRFLRN